jgi:hypothetical protein
MQPMDEQMARAYVANLVDSLLECVQYTGLLLPLTLCERSQRRRRRLFHAAAAASDAA